VQEQTGRQKAEPNSQDTKQDKQESNSCPWEGKNQQPVGIPKPNSQEFEFGKEGTT